MRHQIVFLSFALATGAASETGSPEYRFDRDCSSRRSGGDAATFDLPINAGHRLVDCKAQTVPD